MTTPDGPLNPEHWQEMAGESREARYKYWAAIKRIHDTEWREAVWDDTGNITYTSWLEKTYGIRPNMDPSGNFSSSYTVVNQELFLIFALKHL